MHHIQNILVVDDEKSNIDIILHIFETLPNSDQYELTVCLDPLQALQIVDKIDVDLILLDIFMPTMNGFEVCQKIKSNPLTKDIPIIFITSASDEENIEKAYEVGGIDYVTKPFRIKELISRINTHLALAQQKFLLQKTLDEQIKQIRHQDKILQQQSKLAAMGEMIDAVAHQWKQPLGVLSILQSQVLIKLEQDSISKKFLKNIIQDEQEQIRHMSDTLDEFRSFLELTKNF